MFIAAFGIGVMIMAGLGADSFYGTIMALLTASVFLRLQLSYVVVEILNAPCSFDFRYNYQSVNP